MSNIGIVRIDKFKEKHQLTAFVETGTAGGDGVNAGFSAGFSRVLSCEMHYPSYMNCLQRFANYRNVKIFYGSSVDMLPVILSELGGEKVLFWLDAHVLMSYDPLYDSRETDKLPLRYELDAITIDRDFSKDVIVIDDFRLYDESLRHKDFNYPTSITKKEILAYFPDHDGLLIDKQDYIYVLQPKVK